MFKNAYSNYSEKNPVQLDCSGDLIITEQSHKAECDINAILKKYQRTGVIEHRTTHEASYGFASSIDFQNAMQVVAKAKSMFEELPSSVRAMFNNDPERFLDFVQNDENSEKLYEMGLAVRPPVEHADPSPTPEPAEPIAPVNPPA